MNAFAGVVAFDGALDGGSAAEQLGAAICALHKGRLSTCRKEDALFVQRTGSGQPPGLQPAGRDRIACMAIARLDNRDELSEALGLPLAQTARRPDGELVLRMFERWGERGLARCLGAFCFAHWDASARRLTLGRDCLGRQSLFFHRGRNRLAFATTVQALLAMPGVPRELDDLELAKYLAVNLHEPHRTFYRGIERVPSRTVVTFDAEGRSERHYWSPELGAPPYRREEDYVARARELLDRAVAAATADLPRVAISCSGGLDSSAIAATAARLGRAERIACYTLVPPAGSSLDPGPFKYWDERDKMAALARLHPALDVHLVAPEKPHAFDEDSGRYFARTGLPVLNPGNMGWVGHLNDEIAAAGHRTLLIGSLGNFGLTWHGRFSLVALLAAGRFAVFARDWAALARRSNRSLARTLASEVVMPAGPLWLRRFMYRLVKGSPDSVAFYSALNPAFVADNDLLRAWQERGFSEPWFHATGRDAARVRARLLFDHNQAARDAMAMHAEQFGLELRDPHADRRLLEFALQVPEWMYRRDGVARSFARQVLADRLPPEIVNERRIGAQSGLWFRRADMRREQIAAEIERLESSPLARRLIDVPRLKRLMDDWPADDQAAERRRMELKLALGRGLHVGQFIRWVEGGNA